jgi:hypothetical protein
VRRIRHGLKLGSQAYRVDEFDARKIHVVLREFLDDILVVDGFRSQMAMTFKAVSREELLSEQGLPVS